MFRLACRALAFSKDPLKNFDRASAISFNTWVEKLSGILERENKILLRSEPQSGKSSFCDYLERTCTVFSGGGTAGGVEKLRNVDFVESKKKAMKLGLGPYVVRYFQEVDFENWLTWAREIDATEHAKDTLLLIDEAHLMFSEPKCGAFFKNKKEGKVVFVGTSTASTTLRAATPFVMSQYYMEPAFADRAALVEWFTENVKELWPRNGDEQMKEEWAPHVAKAAVSICGGRVGISNWLGAASVRDITEMITEAPVSDGEIVRKINVALFKALTGTRLMKGDNVPWSDEASVLVAAAMLEGNLPSGLFDEGNVNHRRLYSSSGLRLPSGQYDFSKGRYAGEASIALIDCSSSPTPVCPMAHAQFLGGNNLFPRYDPPKYMAGLMPLEVTQPKTGLDLVLRALPYMNVYQLMCGIRTKEREGIEKKMTFVGGSCFPREIGGFQDHFKEALKLVFGNPPSVAQTKSGGVVDVLVNIGGRILAVEFLVEKSQSSLANDVENHHKRWSDEVKHANYVRHRGTGVTVAFVNDEETKPNGNTTMMGEKRMLFLEEKVKRLKSIRLGEVPLLLVGFAHSAFSWNCVLLRENQAPLSFVLDIDGVAMQLSGNGKGIEPAQRIAASTIDILRFKEFLVNRAPRTFDYVVDDGKRRVVTVSHPWTAALLLEALNLSSSEYDVYAPNRFGHHELVSSGSTLPMTTSSCFIKIKRLRAKRQAKTVIRSRRDGWDR